MSRTSGHILILGAGLMQRPALEAARSLGLRVSLVDANPSAPCVPLADYFEPVDLKNRDAVRDLSLRLKEEQGLSAVFTAGTDFSSTVSYAAEACGFPAHSYEAAVNASDKIRMRGRFKACGVPSPHFLQADAENYGSICLTADRLGAQLFPLVVKPVDNMGGRGCRLVRSRAELEPALDDAILNSRTGRAIVEDFMEGPEFSIDALIHDGTITICGFADRHICFPPYFIETGHTMPARIDAETRAGLVRAFAMGVKALGLTCGAAKADMKLTRKGPMVGEIAARLSGGYMSGWTYPYSSGCPLTEQAELVALGRAPDWLLANRTRVGHIGGEVPFPVYEVASGRACAERAWISVPGTVGGVHGLASAAETGVDDVFPRAAKGDGVVFPRNNMQKCGNVIAAADSAGEAVNAAETAVSRIVLRLSPQNRATDEFLSCGPQGALGFPPDAFPLPVGTDGLLEKECAGGFFFPDAERAAERIPACLEPFLDTMKDWNHRTIRQSIGLYDEIRATDGFCPGSGRAGPAVPSLVFWRACLRAGVQGMLYVADCASGGRP